MQTDPGTEPPGVRDTGDHVNHRAGIPIAFDEAIVFPVAGVERDLQVERFPGYPIRTGLLADRPPLEDTEKPPHAESSVHLGEDRVIRWNNHARSEVDDEGQAPQEAPAAADADALEVGQLEDGDAQAPERLGLDRVLPRAVDAREARQGFPAREVGRESLGDLEA